MTGAALGRAIDTAMDRTIAPGYTRVGLAVRRRLPGWPSDAPPGALAGKHVIVTGATSGLGAATAAGLADLGAELHLVVRNPDKLRGLGDWADDATVWQCDVSDLDDVRRFTEAFLDSGTTLHAIVHNAGSMPPERTESAQGHEMTMALHVLGPVLMTEELRPVLAEGARVVLVTSGGMYAQPLRDDDPEYLKGDYTPTNAYARSKRAQVELLPVLAREWIGVDVHATHPGWADTPGVQESLPTFRRVTKPFLRDADGGAETTVWLVATEPAQPAPALWHDRRPRPTSIMRKTRTSDDQRERLWTWVQTQVKGS